MPTEAKPWKMVVPFTDGRKGLNIVVNLQKAVETDGREVALAIERTVSLMIIDDHWKDHLRNMDDLKQAVQELCTNRKTRCSSISSKHSRCSAKC